MQHHDRENPFLTRYEAILDICLAHNVTISLGDGLRPGCGADAGDGAQWEEVITLGRLAKRARERGVQAMGDANVTVAYGEINRADTTRNVHMTIMSKRSLIQAKD